MSTDTEDFGRALRSAISMATGRPFTTSELSERAGLSRSTVHGMLTGQVITRRPDSLAKLMDAAGVDRDTQGQLLKLWSATVNSQSRIADQVPLFTDVEPKVRRRRRSPQPVPQFGQPDPIRVSNPAELMQALRAVHVWGGSPSLRELQTRSAGRLRRSSVSDMLRSSTLPDYDRYIAFLRACGIEGANLEVWVFTWRRLKAMETPEIASWMPGMWGTAS